VVVFARLSVSRSALTLPTFRHAAIGCCAAVRQVYF
jgi:hypothetical protein